MGVIWNEIKKIFNFKTVGILSVVCLVLFSIYPVGVIESITKGSFKDDIRMIEELRREYGNTLSKADSVDFSNNFIKNKEMLADKYIRENKEAQQLGINSYNELKSYEGKTSDSNEKIRNGAVLFDKLLLNEAVRELWDMERLKYFKEVISKIGVDYYENTSDYDVERDGDKVERYREIAGRPQPLIGGGIISNFDMYIQSVSMIVIIAVVILLATIFIKDKLNRVEQLQYTSKVGKRINNKKIVAGLISLGIVTTIIVGISMAMYFNRVGTTNFFTTDINSVFNQPYAVDITYLQYCVLKVGVLYVLAMGTGLLIMGLSNVVKSEISIVILGVLVFLGFKYLVGSVILRNMLYIDRVQSIVWGSGVLILTATIIGLLLSKRKIVDIRY